MAVEVVVTRRGPCAVVAISGVLTPAAVDDPVLSAIAGAARLAPALVITLDGLEHADPQGLRALATTLGVVRGPGLALVARRNSILAGLVQDRIHHRVDVYPVLGDALAAAERGALRRSPSPAMRPPALRRPALRPPALRRSWTTVGPWRGAPAAGFMSRPRTSFLWHGRSEKSR
jgi:hypothetical protein